MNRLNNEQDMFNIYVSDRRYLLQQIETYEHFLHELESVSPETRTVCSRAVAFVVENYLLIQLEQELRVNTYL